MSLLASLRSYDQSPFIYLYTVHDVAPVDTNDTLQHYVKGSLWYNSTTQIQYVCTSAAAGAATWVTGESTDAVGGDLAGSLPNPTVVSGAHLASHTVPNSALQTTVTVQGNTFNGVSELVQTDGSGNLPALNGAAVTGLAAANITGTLATGHGGTGATASANAASGVVVLNSSTQLPAVSGLLLTNVVAKTVVAAPQVQSAIGTSQNNYSLGTAASLIQHISASVGSCNISGLTNTAGQVTGEEHLLTNVGSNAITFSNQDAASSAANRITTSSGSSVSLAANQTVRVYYDGVLASWRMFTPS